MPLRPQNAQARVSDRRRLAGPRAHRPPATTPVIVTAHRHASELGTTPEALPFVHRPPPTYVFNLYGAAALSKFQGAVKLPA